MELILQKIQMLSSATTLAKLPLWGIWSILVLLSCTGPSLPVDFSRASSAPDIFPDYKDVTIPSNIAPVNFMLPDYEEAVAQLSFGDISYIYGRDNKIIIDADEWKRLCSAAAGSNKGITVDVYGKKDGKWLSFKSFPVYVAKDTIDPYISYRLIQPSYVSFNDLSIVQRDITSFEESDIYNNTLLKMNDKGQCINCHSYQNYSTDNMLFHIRQHLGGTMIVYNGELTKIDLKTDSTLSAGVYPAWNPKAGLIAFSTNTTTQTFHINDNDKIEVFDTESGLILYDLAKNEVSTICNDDTELECFPTWSPDGKTLYYTSAHFEYANPDDKENEVVERYKEIKYNVYARSFDLQTHQFGEPQLVFDAASLGKSATLPRVSPNGRYLTFSLADFGCFHVWHRDADICIIDLKDTNHAMLDAKYLNSDQSDSYPSFSSNGRWVMTSSRRDDGNYTRPYIAYFDTRGELHKAFAVPKQDPEHNTLLLRSYNRPEFMKQKVQIYPDQFVTKASEEPVRAKYIAK